MPIRQFTLRLSRLFAVAAAVLVSLITGGRVGLEAKAPGVTHCHKGVCHRVRTLEETRMLLGSTLVVAASHYDFPWNDRFNIGVFTSNGERFDAGDRDRVSSSDFPDGTELLLRNPDNGHVSHVRVNDFGPFHGDRRLDVTRRVADDLGFAKRGVTELEVTVIAIPREEDLTYRRNRPRTRAMGLLGSYDQAAMPDLITRKISARAPADASRIIITAPLNLLPPAVEDPSGNVTSPVAEASEIATVAAEPLRIEPPSDLKTKVAHLGNSAEFLAPRSGPEAVAPKSKAQSADPVATNHASGTQQATAPADAATITAMSGNNDAQSSPLEATAEAPAFAAQSKISQSMANLSMGSLSMVNHSMVGQSITEGGLHHAFAFAISPAFAASASEVFARAAFVPPPMSTRALLLVVMTLLTLAIIAASWNVGVTPANANPRPYAAPPRAHRIAISPAPIANVVAKTADTLRPSTSTTQAPTAAAQREADVTISAPLAPAAPLGMGASSISPHMRVEGTLRTTGRIAIGGQVEGRIQAVGIEVVAGGIVRGILIADEITIDGHVDGPITARLVRIGPNARIVSDITCELIAMDERANVDASFSRPTAKT